MFDCRAVNISVVERRKIFFPAKSRIKVITAALSKTGSGSRMSSILSDLREKRGVVKTTTKKVTRRPQKTTHHTVRKYRIKNSPAQRTYSKREDFFFLVLSKTGSCSEAIFVDIFQIGSVVFFVCLNHFIVRFV
jgi:hypothetical protein